MGSPVPEFRDQKSIRLLRDVDEHWEQVENGRSLAEVRVTRPDEGPGRIEYNNKHIWIGGFNTLEILQWADEVEEAVRQQAEADELRCRLQINRLRNTSPINYTATNR
jgi:hypothetical protein